MENKSAVEMARSMDAAIEKRLQSKVWCEAFDWLQLSHTDGITRGFSGGMGSFCALTGKKAEKFIGLILKQGAVSVRVLSPPEIGEDEKNPALRHRVLLTADEIVIVLPDNAEQRQQLFRWYKKQAHRQGYGSSGDCGQKYLYFKWD